MISGLPLCKGPPSTECPDRFRVSAAEWIDATNFGDLPCGKHPPAGIRLRWNWSLADAKEPRYPDRFKVLRAGPVDPKLLLKPRVTCGHQPRMFAPSQLWRPLTRMGDRDFVVGDNACASVQAIHVVMSSQAEPVSIALIDVEGRTRLTGELDRDEAFYYEFADLHRVSFSASPHLDGICGISLSAADVSHAEVPLEFHEIASINARACLEESLEVVSERMTAAGHPPFLSISDEDWSEIHASWKGVVEAIDRAKPFPALKLNYVELALAHRWEIAALIGWGFLDGEHVANPDLDEIDADKMLTAPSGKVYAYQIVAEFEKGVAPVCSDIAFTITRLMGALTEATVSSRTAPRTRLELVNKFDKSVPASNKHTVCSSSWDLKTCAPYAERVFTTPRAKSSQIKMFEEVGEFSTNDALAPVTFSGLRRIEHRDHVFNVPSYDSDIWLLLAVGDSWDRRISQAATRPIQPDFEYSGLCLPILGGRCDPKQGTATVDLDMDPLWRADELAKYYSKGKIELLLKDPGTEPLTAVVTLFAPSPARNGNWSADIETSLAPEELSPFVNGTLALDGFQARIIGLNPGRRGRFRCDFEAAAVCAGAVLYNAGSDGVKARLSEAADSGRLWGVVGEIPLLEDGSPKTRTAYVELPKLKTSMVLYFSSRLSFTFEVGVYRGPLTPRHGIPYVHPEPKPPGVCVAIETLGTDYYGRVLVRAEVPRCELFSPELAVAIDVAAGSVEDKSAFRQNAADGIFGAQLPLAHRTVFDGFELLSRQPEGSVNTLGVRYVRTSDGRESMPDLRQFSKRRTD